MSKLLSTSLRGSNYGTLPVENGGTGITAVGTSGNVLTSNGLIWVSQAAPISLPTQTSNSGKFLTTDGTSASWVAGTGSGSLVLNTSPSLTTSVTTTSTTFSLINTTATTVNFAGAATAITIGAGTGTTTINNELHVAGDIFFNGSVNKLNATNIELTDSLIYLSVNNPANIIDIGFFGAYTSASTHLHTGFFRDASDSNIWKLVSGLSVEPTTTVDLTGASFDTLQVGTLLATTITGNLSGCTFPTLNQNTTGTAAGLSSTLAVTSGGTGVTTSTGTGSVVLSTSPTLVTPILGTPTSGNFSTGTFTWPTFNQNTTGTAAGLSSTLAVTSGGTGVTTSTGTGNVVLSNSPTLVTPILGTPTSGDLSNCTNAIAYSLKSATTSVSVSAATAPASGQVLTATSSTTATWQAINGLPTQTSNGGKYLTTDGTNASWSAVGLTATPVKTANYTAVANDLVRCNSTAGVFNIVFPGTPADGTIIGVIDINETFGTNNITIVPTNAYIEGDANGYVLDITGTYVSFIYNVSTTNWRLLVTPTPSAAGTSQTTVSKSMALSIIFGGI
jgi:hypothetical protein